MKTIFQKKLQFGDIWPQNHQKIAQIEIFGHFLDFALSVFLDRWTRCLVVFLQFTGSVNVFLFQNLNSTHNSFQKCVSEILANYFWYTCFFFKFKLQRKIISRTVFQKYIYPGVPPPFKRWSFSFYRFLPDFLNALLIFELQLKKKNKKLKKFHH